MPIDGEPVLERGPAPRQLVSGAGPEQCCCWALAPSGRRLAQLLAPFGLRIIAFKRQVEPAEGVEIIGEGGLEGALAEADHVVNLLPASDSTTNLMNAARFAAMNPGARYYNIGRGSTTDQEALLYALQSGHLGLAYLDVTTPEPLPADHPLWTAPRCFITPHTAGGFAGEFFALADHFLENLRRFEGGEPLLNQLV